MDSSGNYELSGKETYLDLIELKPRKRAVKNKVSKK
jgi:hypothetical protein